MQIDETMLANLSKEEREAVEQILKEMANNNGNSTLYNKLKYQGFKEIPVDIETFITDDRYLGKAWKDAKGNSKVYPFWMEQLKDIFPDPITTKYDTLLESGARGIGKSEVACGIIAPYLMYRVLCMENPKEYFHLKPTEKIVFAFLNIKLDLAEKIAQDKFQKNIQMSPWFMSKGSMTSRNNQPYWIPPEPIEIVIGSQSDDVIGLPIFFVFVDEISFIKNKDVEEQKKKAKDMIDTAKGGMKTRFIYQGKNPTLLCVGSSKRSEQSFMETYIRDLSGDANVKIVDKPVWVVKPKGTYSEEMFWVGLGNKYLDNIVIPRKDYDKLKFYEQKGYNLYAIPIDFEKDANNGGLERVLCDYAGISSFATNKFIAVQVVRDCIDEEIHNPLPDIIECGDGPDDKNVQYSDWFDRSKLNWKYASKPLFIHLDMSASKDKTGIAGVWIIGKKANEDGTPSKDLVYEVAFSTSIKAPTGRQISFAKNREFVRWVKNVLHLKVKKITFDTYQSYDTGQQLSSEGYDTEILSVDRLETPPGEKVGICKPYEHLRNVMYERRIKLYDTDLLYNELIQLEKNNTSGKVDHPDNGKTGCFTGDTKVSLVDGRDLTFLELVKEFKEGKVNYTYSFNHTTKKIEPKPIVKAWCTKHNAKLVEVELDTGEKIRCTPNHRFMLRDGSYCEAQELIPGDSLMPLYRKYPSSGALGKYRMYYEPIEDEWHFEHRQFATEVLDEHYLVHHKDCNPQNNEPTNLVWCSKKMHQAIHTEMQTGAQSPEANAKRKESLQSWYKERATQEQLEAKRKKISEKAILQHYGSMEKYEQEQEKQRARIEQRQLLADEYLKKKSDEAKRISDMEDYFGVQWESLTPNQKDSYSVKWNRLTHPEVQQQISDAVSQNHKKGLYAKSREALNKCNEESKRLKELVPTVDPIKFKEIFGFDFDSLEGKYKPSYIVKYRRIVGKEILNHKVVSITFLDEVEDVYDIEVKDNHNFALASGVFVHNSKDQADAVCGATFTASKYSDKYSYEYGDNIVEINNPEFTTEQVKEQLTVNFEEELKKTLMGNYLKREDDKQTPQSNGLLKYGNPYEAQEVQTNLNNIKNGILVW